MGFSLQCVPNQSAPGLIAEADDDGGLGQILKRMEDRGSGTAPRIPADQNHRLPTPPPPTRREAGNNRLKNEEITPLLSTGIGERIAIEFRTCSALAPM